MKHNQLEPYFRLLHQSPVASAILDASELKLKMVNQSMLDLWDRPASILGRRLLDFLPELAGQPYPQLLKDVIESGELYQESGARVVLERAGKKEMVFMDYSYTPIFSEGPKAAAILIMANDVCEREINRLIINQSDRDLRNIVTSAPVAMCIYRSKDFRIEVINDRMKEIWQQNSISNLHILNHVFYNGVPFSEVVAGTRYCYTPLGNTDLGVEGICLVAAPANLPDRIAENMSSFTHE